MSDSRILRGAASGVIAAAVWAAQQPVDKRVFASRYDDVELLGLALLSERPYGPGLSLHLLNGGLFGVVYAIVAPTIPLPVWARGPALAVGENTVLWPLVRVVDRFHPARGRLPQLTRNRRAFYQATWRHLLFGVVLGELERRLAPAPAPEPPPIIETVYSSNGHGDITRASVPITELHQDEPEP